MDKFLCNLLFFTTILIKYSSSDYYFSVTENQPINTFVGKVLIEETYIYDFIHKENVFQFNKNSGIIRTSIVIDRESLSTDIFEILLYSKTLEDQIIKTFTIKVQINDENDNPPIFYPNKLKRTLVENIGLSNYVSLVVAKDADTEKFGVSNNYKIISGNEENTFSLVGFGVQQYRGQLLLKIVKALDREVKDKYNLVISVEDKGLPPLTGILLVEIVVEDYNDNSPIFSQSQYNVKLNESSLPGFEVIKVYATDSDIGVNKIVEYRFKKTKNLFESEFSIDPQSGSVKLTRKVNCRFNQDVCTLVIEAFDHGSPSLSSYCYVTIRVIRINMFSPILKISYVNSADKTAYIEIGKINKRPLAIIHCQDEDQDSRDLITVSIISGNQYDIFSLERTYGNIHILRQVKEIHDNNVLHYVVKVRAQDSGIPYRETMAEINIKVNEANKYHPVFKEKDVSVVIFKNLTLNSFIARFYATDEDSGSKGKVIYSIGNGNFENIFSINKENGLVTLSKNLWYLKENHFTIQIVARDLGIHSLESVGYLHVKILQTEQLQARFNNHCQRDFVLDDVNGINQIYNMFVYDFGFQVEVSDQARLQELELKLINEIRSPRYFFITENWSLYMLNICRRPEKETLFLGILHESRLLQQIQLSVEITSKLVHLICDRRSTIHLVQLPQRLEYNKLIVDINEFYDRKFDGEFLEVSSPQSTMFSVSSQGKIYWKSSTIVQNEGMKFNITYRYKYRSQTIFENIGILFYWFFSEKTIFNCSKLETMVRNGSRFIQLEKVSLVNSTDVKFILSNKISARYLKIENNTLNLSDQFYYNWEGPKHISLTGYNKKHFQKCLIRISKEAVFNKERYYFKTSENKESSVIGEIPIIGKLNSTEVYISGTYYQYFGYMSDKMLLVLQKALQNDVNVMIIEIRLSLIDSSRNKILSTALIMIEFPPVPVSPIFSEPFYTFVLSENSDTYVPLMDISLESSQKVSDFIFEIREESHFGKWSIFPNGTLYLLSELDYENRKNYSLHIFAFNRLDKNRFSNVSVTIFVQDCNDNVPQFSRDIYYFDIFRDTKPNTIIGRVFALDVDSGLNGFLKYAIAELSSRIDFLELDPMTGVLKITNFIDIIQDQFPFQVTATDFGTPSLSSTVKVVVNIKSSVSKKITFSSQIYFGNVSEDHTVGQEIMRLIANSTSRVMYQITKCSHKNTLSIDKYTGSLFSVKALDRESITLYSLTVVASDQLNLKLSKNFAAINIYLHVTDVNDNDPIFRNDSLQHIIISESVKIGTIIWTYIAEDVDSGLNGTVRYKTTGLPMDLINILKIDSFSGNLYLNQHPDSDYKVNWKFNVTAFDLGNPSRQANLSVTVTVKYIINSTPRFSEDMPIHFSVRLDHLIGTTVGRVYVRNSDQKNIIYSLAFVEPPDHPFLIDHKSGIITMSKIIKSEESYNVMVMGMDVKRKDRFGLQMAKIDIKSDKQGDINILTYGAIVVTKTTFFGEKIATVSGFFNSKFKNFRLYYILVNCSFDKLILNRYTGDLFITPYNQLHSHTIDLTFMVSIEYFQSDNPIKYHSTKLILNQDVSHNLNFQRNDYSLQVYECNVKRGMELIRLQALYPGNPICDLQYFINDIYAGVSERIRLPNTFFHLDKDSGMLSLGNEDLDREKIEGSQITVEVVVIDRGRNASHIRLTKVFVNIIDCNDNAPVFYNETYIFQVAENTSFQQIVYVGTVQAHDKDLDNILVYKWLEKKPLLFHLDENSGIITSVGIPFDYENVTHYTMKVLVSDGAFSSTANVLITVVNINDECHEFNTTKYHFHVKEDAPAHTIIGQVAMRPTSIENHARLKFSLISEWGDKFFSVHPSYGIITTLGNLDYEKETHYILLVTARDISDQSLILPCEESVTTTVFISIIDINDNPPVFCETTNKVFVNESVSIGSEIFQFSASDYDKLDLLRFAIISPNDDLFAINPLTGTIYTVDVLDFEQKEKYLITVSCSDGVHLIVTTVEVSIVNVNDEIPVIHNHELVDLTNLSGNKSVYIKCTDADNLEPLKYNVETVSNAELINVNEITGEIIISSKMTNKNYTSLIFICSDGRHTSSKTVTIIVQNQISSSHLIETEIDVDNELSNSSWNLKMLLRNKVIQHKTWYFFLTTSKDSIFFYIDSTTNELKPVSGLFHRKLIYRLKVIAMVHGQTNYQLSILISLKYRTINSCYPTFIGPYSFRVQAPVTITKLLGTLAVGYCVNHTKSYYLTSGHSFFTVNSTNGNLYVNHSPPLGQFNYKLKLIVNTHPKTFLNTIITVKTTEQLSIPISCEFNVLRITIDLETNPGKKIGKIVIKNLPHDVRLLSFALSQSWPLSILNDGSLVLYGKLNYEDRKTFYLVAEVHWLDQAESNSIKCPIQITIVPPTHQCILAITYPNSFVDLYTFAERSSSGSRFIFGIPIAHQQCKLQRQNATIFSITDQNFVIDKTTGELSSQKTLTDQKYEFSVKISSNNVRNDLIIPIRLFVLNRINDVDIILESFPSSILLTTDTSVGTIIGSVRAKVISKNLHPVLRFSLVHFCCIYPNNIAVFNNSIYQSFFFIDSRNGNLILNMELPKINTVYTLRIRGSLTVDNPSQILFRDTEIQVIIDDLFCKCNHIGHFMGHVEENSESGTVIVKSVLNCNGNRAFNIVIFPQWVQELVYYDLSDNEIKTTSDLIDREKYQYLEMGLNISDNTGRIVQICPGVIHVVDVNDNAPRFTLNYFMGSVPENAAIGTWILDIGAVDSDSKAFPLKYILLGVHANIFHINPHNGSVYLSKPIDREKIAQYEMKVAVSDGVHVLDTGMLIRVTDINDNYPRISSEINNQTFVINKSQFAKGSVMVTIISAFDDDDPLTNNSKIVYHLQSDNSKLPIRSLFMLDENSGHLMALPALLHWLSVNNSMVLSLLVSDKGNPPLSTSVQIHLLFINIEYELTIFNETFLDPVAVVYTTSAGTSILTISINHKESFRNVSYQIINGNGTTFFSLSSLTGQIIATKNINSADIGTWFSFHIRACGYRISFTGLFCSKQETLILVISDFNFFTPQLRISKTMLSISEKTKVGTRLLQLDITDQDVGLTGFVKLVFLPPLHDEFQLVQSLNEKSYDLVLSTPLDYERQQQYSLNVLVYDLGLPQRKQMSTIFIKVFDEDDNIPYFNEPNFVFPLTDHIQEIRLPPFNDDDSDQILKEPHYKVTVNFSTVISVNLLKNQFSLRIKKRSWNESIISINLQMLPLSDSLHVSIPGRYQNIKIYIILPPTIKTESALSCSYKQINLVNETLFMPLKIYPINTKSGNMYHILLISPKKAKQYLTFDQRSGRIFVRFNSLSINIIISLSSVTASPNDYQVCFLSVFSKHFKSLTPPFKIVTENLYISKNIKSGETLGRISILPFHSSNLYRFHHRIYSDHHLPFNITDSGHIISLTNIFTNYPTVYNVLIKVMSSINHDDSVTARFGIFIKHDKLTTYQFPISLNVRENIGEGVILGSIMTIIQQKTMGMGIIVMGKNFSDVQEKILIDRKGIIHVKKSIDREKEDKIPLVIYGYFLLNKTSVIIDITIEINDENDCTSTPRNVDISFGVFEKFRRLTRLIRLIPNDNDILGNYQCRLDTLKVPLGVLVTPDCWLYILNESSIFSWQNDSFIRVSHHDGRHKAVVSKFYLKPSFISNDLFNQNLIILKFSHFHLESVIKSLKSLKHFLSSSNFHLTQLAIDRENRFLIMWFSFPSKPELIKQLNIYKSELEILLKTEHLIIIDDLCHKNACNSRGVCSTVVDINHNKVFSDERYALHSDRKINIYSSITFSVKCICDKGHLGKRCNLSNKCSQQICHNGGVCVINETGQSVCDCQSGYYGVGCDKVINDCEQNNPCSSHGSCINTVGGFKCECHLNWIGSNRCTLPMDHCLANPCSTTGTEQCVPMLGEYKCRCLFGNYGDKCQNSAISFVAESFLEMELSSFSNFSFEFSTIMNDSPLVTIVVSRSKIFQISLSSGSLRVTIFTDTIITSEGQNNQQLSNGLWWRLTFQIHSNHMTVVTFPCGDLNGCEFSNDIYSGYNNHSQQISMSFTKVYLQNPVQLIIGSNHKIRSTGSKYFVGCIRNLQIQKAVVTRKNEHNLLNNSCPRYRKGFTPCSNSTMNCGGVGQCIDEWFTARCKCPHGYQPPSCSPGYASFSFSPNTVIAFNKRPELILGNEKRKKRSIIRDNSIVSMRIKTKDTSSIILLALSSPHSFTIIQIENGYIKVIDKYASSTQEMVHKAVRVNDDKIHVVVVSRQSTGTVSVTIDFIVAQVNWLQSHDIIGQSVHTLYLAGIPQSFKVEHLINIPNFAGCLSDIRFNNETMPLNGLTETFNVSILQGSFNYGCPSNICLQSGICDKYQKCEEISGVPNSIWGQYKCVDDKNPHLMTLVIPILIGLLISMIIITLIIVCIKLKAKRSKAKNVVCSSEMKIDRSKNQLLGFQGNIKSNDQADNVNKKIHGSTPRSIASNALLMQDLGKRNLYHPDVIRSHEVMFEPEINNKMSNFESMYYHDATIPNPYLFSGNMTMRQDITNKSKKFPRNSAPLIAKNLKKFNYSTGTLKETDDSLVYHCSHPDDYEAVESLVSSNTSHENSLNQPQFSFSFKMPSHRLLSESVDHPYCTTESIVSKNCDIHQSSSSSSNISNIFIQKPSSVRRTLLSNKRKMEDIFSNTESNLTTNPDYGISLDSLSSSSNNSQNVFTPTNSSESVPSNENNIIPNSSNCWKNFQRALPPPPPSEDQYKYADK